MASRAVFGHALLGASAAILPALAMWGFTVDDALVSIRYAHDIAIGAGYRFDPNGPSTDGVTPLPWAYMLAPFARSDDALSTLTVAKALGVVCWAGAAAALGARLAVAARAPESASSPRTSVVALVVMALAFPIGAWAASGMETGLATALATLAATQAARPRRAAALAGLAASLRPEMVVWAVTLASLSAFEAAPRAAGATSRTALAREVTVAGGIAALPFVACALVRLFVFGRAAPLALLAKPSDLSHGAVYAAAAVVVVLLPVLAFAPVAIVKTPGPARAIAAAFVAHVLAVIVAGGDWMPYARLVVPVAPSLVLVVAATRTSTRQAFSVARTVVALVVGVVLAVRVAPAGRRVEADRRDLVARARPVLASSRVVAAIDIGWLSAATSARIVDLAGLTDPAIAALPGGHTSKRVDAGMLLDREVDTFLVYEDARGDIRVAEARIVRAPIFAERFERAETLPLGATGARYVVFRRR